MPDDAGTSPSRFHSPYGRRASEAALDRRVVLPRRRVVGVEPQHLARAEPSASDLAVAAQRHRAGLGAARDDAVVGLLPAQRPQPVAVERRADAVPVGEDQPGRAVPRLGQAGVVAEVLADVGRKLAGRPPTPRGRASRRRGAGRARRAGAARGSRRASPSPSRTGRGPVAAPSSGPRPAGLGAEHAAGEHAVLVALERVDLAVVAEQPERLGALPRRQRVRREAAVEHDVRRDERRVGEVGVEEGQPVAEHERLVGDRPEREAREVVADAFRATGRLGASPGARTPAARRRRRPSPRGAAAALGSGWAGRQRVGPEVRLVDGDGPPAGELESLRRRTPSATAAWARRTAAPSSRSKNPNATPRRAGVERPVERRGTELGEEGVRDRREDTGTVARHAVRGDRGAVAHTAQPLERELDDAARRARGVGDEADAAAVELGLATVVARARPRSPRTVRSVPPRGREVRGATRRPHPEPGSNWGDADVAAQIVPRAETRSAGSIGVGPGDPGSCTRTRDVAEPGPLVGVLGGGQLGRMLGLAGLPLGLRFRFLDPSADAPTAALGALRVAPLDDTGAAAALAEGCDVVTYEWEGVPVASARAAAARAPVRPGVDAARDRAGPPRGEDDPDAPRRPGRARTCRSTTRRRCPPRWSASGCPRC